MIYFYIGAFLAIIMGIWGFYNLGAGKLRILKSPYEQDATDDKIELFLSCFVFLVCLLILWIAWPALLFLIPFYLGRKHNG